MIDPAEEKRQALAGRRFWQRLMLVCLIFFFLCLTITAVAFICGDKNYLKGLLAFTGMTLFCSALCWTQYEGWQNQIRNITESE